ncbi:WD40 repeat domain-containing protein [Anabaena sp. PCC 7108]|uniref:WD40 repeat domain-containing protein n=1 Tax=Anabaena sp. PCC 7108 TaxID=163908 RepID=UPI00034C5E48|nr:hypothetical protein [Anabaena sp. PCC 7108]
MGNIATKLAAKPAEFKSLFLGQFPEQHLKAGNSDKYYQTLTDFDFISLKIEYPKFGIEALTRDYLLVKEPEKLENLAHDKQLTLEQIKTLKIIQQTLELSSHVVNQDSNQLVGQLWGRLQSCQQRDIQQILADAAQSKSKIPRLCPITASLTTPGGNLLRTLTGHNSYVQAVAITPDGKKAVSGSNDDTLKVWDLETGKELSTFIGESSIFCCAVSPNGLTIVVGEQSGRLHFLRLEGGDI